MVWKLVKDLFLQDLLCCWIYQRSILNISIILVDSICGVLKVVTMSICNKVMTKPDNPAIESDNWLIEPSKFVAAVPRSFILITIVGSKVCH